MDPTSTSPSSTPGLTPPSPAGQPPRRKNGCLYAVLAVVGVLVVFALVSCVGITIFSIWLTQPGEIDRDWRYISGDETGYAEVTLEADDPGFLEFTIHLANRLQDLQRSPFPFARRRGFTERDVRQMGLPIRAELVVKPYTDDPESETYAVVVVTLTKNWRMYSLMLKGFGWMMSSDPSVHRVDVGDHEALMIEGAGREPVAIANVKNAFLFGPPKGVFHLLDYKSSGQQPRMPAFAGELREAVGKGDGWLVFDDDTVDLTGLLESAELGLEISDEDRPTIEAVEAFGASFDLVSGDRLEMVFAFQVDQVVPTEPFEVLLTELFEQTEIAFQITSAEQIDDRMVRVRVEMTDFRAQIDEVFDSLEREIHEN